MSVFPLLAASFIMSFVAVFFVICAVVLILVVLIQKGKGGGLSAAFGGGMASGILGSKTGDFLTWVTIALVGLFLTLAVVLAKWHKPSASDYDMDQMVQQTLPQSQEQPSVPAVPGGVDTDMNSPGG